MEEDNGQERMSKQFLSELIDRINNFAKLSVFQKLPRKGIILFGDNKSGKTTLLYYLMGWNLKRIQNEDTGVFQIRATQVIDEIQIGGDSLNYPNIGICNNQVAIIEMPDLSGFSIKGVELMQAKLYFHFMLSKFEQLHYTIVLPHESIELATEVVRRVQEFTNLFEYSEHKEQFSKAISLVLTKTEDQYQMQEFIQKINQVKSSNDSQEASFVISILTKALQKDQNQESRLHQFRNQEIDVENGMKLRQLISHHQFIRHDLIKVKKQNGEDVEDLQEAYFQNTNQCLVMISKIIETISEQIKGPQNNKSENKGEKSNEILMSYPQQKTQIQGYLVFLDDLIKKMHQIVEGVNKQDQLSVQIKKFILQSIQNLTKILPPALSNRLKQQFQQISNKISCFDLIFLGVEIDKANLNTIMQSVQSQGGLGHQSISKLLQIQQIKKFCKKNKLNNIAESKKRVVKAQKNVRISNLKPVKAYDQILNEYLTNLQNVNQILKLPNRILKFDLLHRILVNQIKRSSLQRNYQEQQILIKTMAKILQKYNLYKESIMYLMIIPDFNTIQILLEEAADKDPDLSLYKKSNQIYILQRDFVRVIYQFALKNMRDSLAMKCANILTFKFSMTVNSFQQFQRQYTEKVYKEFKKRLETFKVQYSDGEVFMNYSNCGNGMADQQRSRIVSQAISFEENPVNNFAQGLPIEACEWILHQFSKRISNK